MFYRYIDGMNPLGHKITHFDFETVSHPELHKKKRGREKKAYATIDTTPINVAVQTTLILNILFDKGDFQPPSSVGHPG